MAIDFVATQDKYVWVDKEQRERNGLISWHLYANSERKTVVFGNTRMPMGGFRIYKADLIYLLRLEEKGKRDRSSNYPTQCHIMVGDRTQIEKKYRWIKTNTITAEQFYTRVKDIRTRVDNNDNEYYSVDDEFNVDAPNVMRVTQKVNLDLDVIDDDELER